MAADVRLYKLRVAVVLGGISIDDTLQPETLHYPTRVLRESVAHYHTHWPTRRSIGYQNRASYTGNHIQDHTPLGKKTTLNNYNTVTPEVMGSVCRIVK